MAIDLTVKTVDRYGAPDYGPIKSPVSGIVFHSPEWGSTPTLANAIACAEWQATSGNTSGGSYHGLIGHQGSDDMAKCANPLHWVMVRSVPWNHISGGLSTRRDAVWAPQRYPWILQLVHAAALADTNAYMHQISLAGSAAWYVTNGYPKGLLIALARWVKILENSYNHNNRHDAVLTLHRHWQTNRTDPGPLNLGDLVVAEYMALDKPAPTPTPVPTPTPTPTPDPTVAELKARITELEKQLATANGKNATLTTQLQAALADARNQLARANNLTARLADIKEADAALKAAAKRRDDLIAA